MLASVAADQLFDRPSQRQRFANRRSLAHLHNKARNSPRSRLFPQFAKQAGQFLFAVLVYNLSSSQRRSRIHAHVERTVSHEAEPALCIFELPGRDTQVQKRAANAANAKLVENGSCMPEIPLPHNEAPPEMRQSLTHVLHCIGVLIQGQNIRAAFQERLGMAAAPACSIHNERTRFWLEQL